MPVPRAGSVREISDKRAGWRPLGGLKKVGIDVPAEYSTSGSVTYSRLDAGRIYVQHVDVALSHCVDESGPPTMPVLCPWTAGSRRRTDSSDSETILGAFVGAVSYTSGV